jgi:hypothetical protein
VASVASPWALEVAFAADDGRSRLFAHRSETPALGEESLPLVFPLEPGRWRVASTTLEVGRARVPFSLLPEASPPPAVEVKEGEFLHLGELEVSIHESTNAAGRPDVRVKTLYLPVTPPRENLWRAFVPALERIDLQMLVTRGGDAFAFGQVPARFVYERDSGPVSATASVEGFVALLSNAAGHAFFEDKEGRLLRVRSHPLGAHHVYGVRTNAEGVSFRGLCLASDSTASVFSPECPLATLQAPGDAPRNAVPVSAGTVRYLGFLDVDTVARTRTLAARLPDDARQPLASHFGGAQPLTFVLGETIRTRDPDTWDYVDSKQRPVVGFPPPAAGHVEAFREGMQACAQEFWGVDPLATTEFLLWIEAAGNDRLSVVPTRSEGFAGPGLNILKACVDGKLAGLSGAATTVLGLGFGIRFR